MRTLLCLVILFVASCAQRPVSWTPALVEATQQNFTLAGTWSFTARSGSQFGKRCDYLFEESGTYRKSCKPPHEERGTWKQVGEWDGRSFKLRLTDRSDVGAGKAMKDAEFTVTVDSPDHDVMSFGGELYERI